MKFDPPVGGMKYISGLIGVLLGLFVLSGDGVAEDAKMQFSGVVLVQGDNPVLRDFTRWLSRKADYTMVPAYADSYQSVSESLKEHGNDLAWTCGAPFAHDHVTDGQLLVAVPLFQGKPVYHSLTITRSGHQEEKITDFAGQVLAYSDPRSNSGFVVPAYVLQEQGVDISRHFRLLLHTGMHEGSIRAVLEGLADVANVDEYVYVEYLKSHPLAKDKLKVVQRFGPYPFTPIVAGNRMPPDVLKRLQQALVGMAADKRGSEILGRLGLDGFVVKDASFYDPIVRMLSALHQ